MSDIHYLSYTPESMWEAMMEAYVAVGGEVLYPGDEKYMLMRAMLAVLVSAYAAHDTAALMRTLRYAVGGYLDLLGETKGVTRIPAAKASATATLVLKGTGTMTVAAGTLFTTDGRTYYQTAAAVMTIGTGVEKSVPITLTCTMGGVAGNGLAALTELRPVVANRNIIRAVLTADTSGGREAEADEDYRERIRLAGANSATTGPAMAYREKAMAVSTAITDARAVRTDAGGVAVYLLFDEATTESARTATITAVLSALNAEDERPLTDLVTAEEAATVPYELNVSYQTPESVTEDVLTAIGNAANDYQKWQEGEIGRAFDPHRLLAMMYSAGATRVEFAAGSNVDGAAVAYLEIDDTKCFAGTVTITLSE